MINMATHDCNDRVAGSNPVSATYVIMIPKGVIMILVLILLLLCGVPLGLVLLLWLLGVVLF
jgi:hypothetical protein